MPARSAARRSRRWSGRPSGLPGPERPGWRPPATLRPPSSPRQTPQTERPAAALWEHAARAALTNAGWATALEQAGQAQDLYRQGGDARSAARAQTIAGQALRRWGRHAQARDQLTAAVEVLRADPDAHTARALGELAAL